MTINIYNISNYDEILIENKTLVILDIDETIFKFNNIDYQWWIDNINRYIKLGYDYVVAEKIVYKKWINYIKISNPILLDKDKLFELFIRLEKTNSHLIILSARTEDIRELTHNNLLQCGIKIDDYNLFLTKNKGDMINKLLLNEYIDYKNVIFIDDLEKNIIDVKDKLNYFNNNYNIKLYWLKHINL